MKRWPTLEDVILLIFMGMLLAIAFGACDGEQRCCVRDGDPACTCTNVDGGAAAGEGG